jgi:hypothetical protein
VKGRRALADNRLQWAALTRVMDTVLKPQPA